MEIYKDVTFEAAHSLPGAPEGHKCRRLHGHSFRVRIFARGPVDEKLGWVRDFADIAEAFRPLHEELDHHHLNRIEGLENPTSENLARWIWKRLGPRLPGLTRIEVQETCHSGCIYSGEGGEGPTPGNGIS